MIQYCEIAGGAVQKDGYNNATIQEEQEEGLTHALSLGIADKYVIFYFVLDRSPEVLGHILSTLVTIHKYPSFQMSIKQISE